MIQSNEIFEKLRAVLQEKGLIVAEGSQFPWGEGVIEGSGTIVFMGYIEVDEKGREFLKERSDFQEIKNRTYLQVEIEVKDNKVRIWAIDSPVIKQEVASGISL